MREIENAKAKDSDITSIDNHLNQAKEGLLNVCSYSCETLGYSPQNGGWSCAQVLEHVSLTNSFLLIIIRRHVDKALKANSLNSTPQIQLDRLSRIGDPAAFKWPHPTHMTPSENPNISEVAKKLLEQFTECQALLAELGKSSGFSRSVNMSVDGLGKLNMYEWIEFLAQHGIRHIAQIDRVLDEINGSIENASLPPFRRAHNPELS